MQQLEIGYDLLGLWINNLNAITQFSNLHATFAGEPPDFVLTVFLAPPPQPGELSVGEPVFCHER